MASADASESPVEMHYGDKTGDGPDKHFFTYVAYGMACVLLVIIFLCLIWLRREEKELIRKRLIGRRERSSSCNATELAAQGAGAYDERPLEGIAEAAPAAPAATEIAPAEGGGGEEAPRKSSAVY